MELPTESLSKVGSKLELGKAASVASPVAAILVSILIVFFVVWPKFSQVLRLRSANDQLAVRVSELDTKAQTLEGLDRVVLERYLVASEALLPSEKGVFTLIAQIEGAAQSSGVLLTRLDVTPGALSPDAVDKAAPAAAGSGSGQAAEGDEAITSQRIQVKVSVGSDYKSFLQFLSNLFTAPRVTSVKDLTVAAASSESNQLKANMTIEAYWQELPSELPSIETPVADLTIEEIKRLESVRTTGQIQEATSQAVPLGRSDLFAPF